MKNIPLLVGTLLGTVALIFGVAFIFAQASKPKMVDPALAAGDARHVKGSQNAKVTVVEFSDLQCPGCRGAQPTVDQMLQKYPNDVKFIYRQYPLRNIHKNAQKAAEVAEVAASFGKFWQIHDLFFQEQDRWAEMNESDFQGVIDEYIAKLQIDKTQFQQRIENQEIKDKISQDISDGDKAGVDATPTFYVNGQKTSAQQLIPTVESFLNSNK